MAFLVSIPYESPASLPKPNDDELNLSTQLHQHIVEHIKNNGVLSLYDYINMALYHPRYGYYSHAKTPFGEHGDFITAAELGPWLAHALAMQYLKCPTEANICEIGAGQGLMALQMLQYLQKQNRLPTTYFILETSATLKAQQQDLFAKHPKLNQHVIWCDDIPKQFDGLLFANEVLDAMPVHQYKKTKDDFMQHCVNVENNKLVTSWELADDVLLPEEVLMLEEGDVFEINPHYHGWLTHLFESMSAGLVILIDYGKVARNYLKSGMQGYLRCFYKHRVHGNIFLYPGLCDITTHVDFSSCAHAADEAGFNVTGFCSQGVFILKLCESLIHHDLDPKQQIKQTAQLKELTMPDKMGAAFKVLSLTKGNKYEQLFEGDFEDDLIKL